MVAESRAGARWLVRRATRSLQEEPQQATDLSRRVTQLEGQMKRLSDEVSTDQLTQITRTGAT